MTFGLSLGCVYKFVHSENRDDIITLYRENFKNDINAIEIVMPGKDIDNFILSEENYEWLKTLNYISVHLLSTPKSYEKMIMIIKQLPRIDKFICHYNWKIIPEFFLSHFHKDILLENTEDLPWKGCCANLCFDISHALKFGFKYLINFFEVNIFDIKEIHLSNFISGKCHKLFQGTNTLLSLKREIDLKKYPIPIIVENICENLEELKKEIKFIKENL
jgi:hypothetical protein